MPHSQLRFRFFCREASGPCSFPVLRTPSLCRCLFLPWVFVQSVPCSATSTSCAQREALSGLGISKTPLLQSSNSGTAGKNSLPFVLLRMRQHSGLPGSQYCPSLGLLLSSLEAGLTLWAVQGSVICGSQMQPGSARPALCATCGGK